MDNIIGDDSFIGINKDIKSLDNNERREVKDENLIDTVKNRVCHTIELDEIHSLEIEFIAEMDKEIIGQDEAKREVAKMIKNSVLGTRPKKGPLGVLFFSGPTGVGKTEIVKCISKVLMGHEDLFAKINCEAFQDSHSKRQLFGAPPSYVGYGEPTPLDPKILDGYYESAKNTGNIHDSIRNLPSFNIILFDEFEKAHQDVAQSLLGILDEGKVTFGNGKTGYFRNSIIIFTSNIGQKEIEEANSKTSIGFIPFDNIEKNKDNSKFINEAIKKRFSPEFRGRITKFVEFDSLTKEQALEIIKIQELKLNEHYKKYYRNINLSISLGENLLNEILNSGFNQKNGARGLKVAFESLVDNSLINLFNSAKFQDFYYIKAPFEIFLDLEGNKPVYKIFIDDNINNLENDKNESTEIVSTKFNSLIFSEGINLNKLFGLNSLMREYISIYNLHIDDDEADFSSELIQMEKTFFDLGFSSSDIRYLKNCSMVEVLSEITSLGRFDFFEKNKDNFYPLTQRVVYKYVEKKVLNYVEKKGTIDIQPHDIIDDVGVYLSENFFGGNNLTTKQIFEIVFFIGKVYAEKFNLEIKLDDYIK